MQIQFSMTPDSLNDLVNYIGLHIYFLYGCFNANNLFNMSFTLWLGST